MLFLDSIRTLLRMLDKSREMLTFDEIKLVEDIREIMDFFIEPLTYLQGVKYPTLCKSAKYIIETKAKYVNTMQFILHYLSK